MDRKLGLTQGVARALPDPRRRSRIDHSLLSLVRQRIYGLAQGYEDLNDHDTLRHDLAWQTAVERDVPLASSPTLCRLENRADRQAAWAMQEVLRKWLQAGFMENRILFPTEAGTPQGGIISPTLANLTLDGLEGLLREVFPPNQLPRPKVNLIRYADDFIITGSTKELLENEVRPLVEQFLLDRGLQLSPEKTCITHIETGFDFLGQNLRKFSGRLLIQPSKKNTHALLEKMRQIIRRNRGVSQTDLIRQLNPVLRGWAFYHCHSAAKRTYKKVEWALWHSLLRWGKHRHNNKSSRWVFQKYWHSIGDRNEFAVDSGKRTADGKIVWLKLYKTTDTSIRRHPRIRGEANPFDPSWHAYFEDRAFFKRFGIRRWEAGLKPSSRSAPSERRGFVTA